MTAGFLAAIGAMKALAEEGVKVPQDVSVVGFGDFRLAAYVAPALTTVKLPLEDIGRRSAEALIEQQHGEPMHQRPGADGLLTHDASPYLPGGLAPL